MYTRLWWKEWRQFWPIWLFILCAALLIQAFTLGLGSENAGKGIFVFLAAMWVSLYAVAVGAGAIAGEQEIGGMKLLDALPASRRVVWSAKVGFGIASSAALLILLLALAWLGTDPSGMPVGMLQSAVILALIAPTIAFAAGLFFSSCTPSAITAAVLGIVTTLVALPVNSVTVLVYDVPWGIGIIWTAMEVVVLVLGSWLIFTHGNSLRPATSRFYLQSPIVYVPRGDGPVSVPRLAPRSALAAAIIPGPILAAGPAQPLAIRVFPRSIIAELRALAWQALREMRGLGAVILILAIATSLFAAMAGGAVDAPWLFIVSGISLLAAGTSVFGIESQARSQRFLSQHAARPGAVWAAKIGVWLVVLAVIAFFEVLPASLTYHVMGSTPAEVMTLIAVGLILFTLAILCGMAIRRMITAAVVAMVFTLVLGVVAGLASATNLSSPFSLFAIPPLLLLTTWAWAGDWLYERPGAGRWVRLGLLMIGSLFLISLTYCGSRAWGIRDLGALSEPAAWSSTSETVTEEQNAAEIYRRIAHFGRFADNQGVLLSQAQREVEELANRAVERPFCVFVNRGKLTRANERSIPRVAQIISLAFEERFRQHMQEGKLDRALETIVLRQKIARHLGSLSVMQSAQESGLLIESALYSAIAWTKDPAQTEEQLRAAESILVTPPSLPLIRDVIHGESRMLEQTLALSNDELVDYCLSNVGYDPRGTRLRDAFRVELSTTPWEVERARRLNRVWARRELRRAELPASIRLGHVDNSSWNIDLAPELTPLTSQVYFNTSKLLNDYDRIQAQQALLDQIIAIRHWQFRHDGAFPVGLDQLVPEVVKTLPMDPGTGGTFRFSRLPGDAGAMLTSPRWPSQSVSVEPLEWRVEPSSPGGGVLAVRIPPLRSKPVQPASHPSAKPASKPEALKPPSKPGDAKP